MKNEQNQMTTESTSKEHTHNTLSEGQTAVGPKDMQDQGKVSSGKAPDSRKEIPAPDSKRKRSIDDRKNIEKKKVKKLSQDPPKRKRDVKDEGEDKDKASKRSKGTPSPPEKPQGKKKSPNAVTIVTPTLTIVASSPKGVTISAGKKAAIPKISKAPSTSASSSSSSSSEEKKIAKEKVKSAPKLSTAAALSNWSNKNPDEKLGDAKIADRERALRRLNEVKKHIEARFRELYIDAFAKYERKFLDATKGEDRRDPEIVEHLDRIEGLIGKRDNEREDLRRRILAFKDPKLWDEAAVIKRQERKKEKQTTQEQGQGQGGKATTKTVTKPNPRAQALVAVLNAIPNLEFHVDNLAVRVEREAKRVRADILLEKKGQRTVATRRYEVPLDRFAAKTLKSITSHIEDQDVKDAKDMLARTEAPDEGPGDEEESEEQSGSTEGAESEENAEYVQL